MDSYGIEQLCQVIIVVTGVVVARLLTRPHITLYWPEQLGTSVVLVGHRVSTRPTVFYVGLVGQFAWLYSTVMSGQVGMLLMSAWWTWNFATGLAQYQRDRQSGRTCR